MKMGMTSSSLELMKREQRPIRCSSSRRIYLGAFSKNESMVRTARKKVSMLLTLSTLNTWIIQSIIRALFSSVTPCRERKSTGFLSSFALIGRRKALMSSLLLKSSSDSKSSSSEFYALICSTLIIMASSKFILWL